jgi:hypothetical protein
MMRGIAMVGIIDQETASDELEQSQSATSEIALSSMKIPEIL